MLPFKLKKKNLIRFTAVAVIVLLSFAFARALKSPLLSGLKGPFSLINFVARQTKGIIFYHHNLLQNEQLKKEIELLRYKLGAMEEVQIENKRLQNLLLFKQKPDFKVIAARVIARSADNWSCLVIIDKGRYSGIKRSMPVINYLGLVGRVVEVLESSSKIMLISDPNFTASAIDQRSRQEGLVSGALGSSLVMRYLPRDCDIKVHDTIITSGLSDFYPKGLLIGSVTDVAEEFSGLSRYAIIKPAVDPSGIEEVLVIVE